MEKARILAEIVMAIVAVLGFALVLDDRNFFQSTLTYTTKGPKCDAGQCELEVWLHNGGKTVAEEIRLRAPSLLKIKGISASVGHQQKTIAGQKVEVFDSVYPDDPILIGLRFDEVELPRFEFMRQHLSFYSKSDRFGYAGEDSDLTLEFPWWWWGLIYCMAAMIIHDIVYWLFETPACAVRRYRTKIRSCDQTIESQTRRKAKLKLALREFTRKAAERRPAPIAPGRRATITQKGQRGPEIGAGQLSDAAPVPAGHGLNGPIYFTPASGTPPKQA